MIRWGVSASRVAGLDVGRLSTKSAQDAIRGFSATLLLCGFATLRLYAWHGCAQQSIKWCCDVGRRDFSCWLLNTHCNSFAKKRRVCRSYRRASWEANQGRGSPNKWLLGEKVAERRGASAKRSLSEEVAQQRKVAHSSIHPSFHPSIHSSVLVYSLICWFMDSLVHWLWLIDFLVRCLVDSLVFWFTYSMNQWFTDSLFQWLIHLFIRSLIHWFIDSLICWFTDSLGTWCTDSLSQCALFDWFIGWLIGPRIHRFIASWFIDLLVRWFIDFLSHWLTTKLIHWLIGSLLRCFIYSVAAWFNDWLIHPLIHWFIASFLRWFADSSIHSVICEWICWCHYNGISTTICAFADAPHTFNTSLLLDFKTIPILFL